MKYIKNGKIIMPDGEIEGKALVFSNKIVGIIDESEIGGYGFGDVYDARGGIISPGLIDIHIHGYLGEDATDGSEEGIIKMANALPANGVTAWLPTTMTASLERLEKVFDVIREIEKKGKDSAGARILGANAEGPFISPEHKGAQKEEYIIAPDAEFLIRNSDVIKLTTIAPEVDGACDAIKEVVGKTGMVISMGHTSASFEEANAGIQAGVRHATHLFNAMTPLRHRAPGVVGASLAGEKISCELIADTFHIDPGIFKLIFDIKKDKLILITDCTRAGGLEDGEYDLGGQTFTKKGVSCTLPDGTIAGSVLKLNEALYNFRKHTGLRDYEVISLASKNPAELLMEGSRGTLEKGKNADIVIFDRDFGVVKTFINGREIKI